jgi:hypothetical protein
MFRDPADGAGGEEGDYLPKTWPTERRTLGRDGRRRNHA